jgi:hypothetical protein
MQSNGTPGQNHTAARSELLTPRDVQRDYSIPENTQAVWRCNNRLGFRDLVIKLGSGVRYRRSDIERWIESRRLAVTE